MGEEARMWTTVAGINEKLAQLCMVRELCTSEQLDDALRALRVAQSVGARAELADVLVEKGYLTTAQLKDVRRALSREGARPTIAGYELLDRVGQGGMGSVYRARQRVLNRIVALKVLAPALAADPAFIHRFRREARLAARLSHPNLVQVFNIGQDRGRHFIAMEFVEGPSVAKLIERQGSVAEGEAIDIAIGAAQALGVVASSGIIHRDVKPSNLMLTPSGITKLTDLGLAKSTEDDLCITRTGAAVGTPHYMSPEQAMGKADIDIRSDIYSLGATLYHMLTGAPPFKGATAFDTLRMHVDEPLTPPVQARAAVSPSMSAAIMRMMAKDPKERFQDPREIVAEMGDVRRRRGALPGRAVASVPQSESNTADDATRVGRRRRLWPWIVWALATGSLIGTMLAVVERGRASRLREPSPTVAPELKRRRMSRLPALVRKRVRLLEAKAWGETGSGKGQFRSPADVAVAANGRVYVADTWNHRIQYFDAGGAYLGEWGGEGREAERFFAPGAVVIDGSGSVRVADTGRGRIITFSSVGLFLSVLGRPGVERGEFARPSGLAVSNSGLIFVTEELNHRIQALRADGTWLRTIVGGEEGADRLRRPRGIAIDLRGNMYVADSGSGRVLSASSNERPGGIREIDVGPYATPVGVCCDAAGRVYVTDVRNHRICILVQGRLFAAWGEPGSGPEQLGRPEGIAAGPDGAIYVADTGNDRILRLRFVLDSTGGGPSKSSNP